MNDGDICEKCGVFSNVRLWNIVGAFYNLLCLECRNSVLDYIMRQKSYERLLAAYIVYGTKTHVKLDAATKLARSIIEEERLCQGLVKSWIERVEDVKKK